MHLISYHAPYVFNIFMYLFITINLATQVCRGSDVCRTFRHGCTGHKLPGLKATQAFRPSRGGKRCLSHPSRGPGVSCP